MPLLFMWYFCIFLHLAAPPDCEVHPGVSVWWMITNPTGSEILSIDLGSMAPHSLRVINVMSDWLVDNVKPSSSSSLKN